MDGLTLYKIVSYIDQLTNKTLNGIYLNGDIVYLPIFYDNRHLHLTFDTLKGEIYFSDDSIMNNPIFKKLSNSKLITVKQRGYDRIFYLKIAKGKRSSGFEFYKIVFEVVGGNSNLFILDENNNILYKLNDKNIDKDRELKIGERYQPYKSNKIMNLDNVNYDKFKVFEELEGFYKKTSEYANNLYKSLNKDLEKVVNTLKGYLNDGYLYIDNTGACFPFPITDQVSKIAIHEYSGRTDSGNDSNIQKYSKKIDNMISKKIDLLNKVKKDLENAKGYEKLLWTADIIKSNLYRLDEALNTGIFYRYTEEGFEKVKLQIAEGNVTEYIDKLYKKSKKLERSIPILTKRIAEIEGEILFLEEVKFYLLNGGIQEGELSFILGDKKFDKIKEKAMKKTISRYYTYRKGDNVLYIGKNSLGNDEILKIADKDDIWFHVQGVPSSHVILKNRDDISEDDISEVCQITAFYSKLSGESKVWVDYTKRKYVRKVKGAPSGFVLYDNFKSMLVKPATPETLKYEKVD
ncbi:MAG: NFACT RNA binding domain-containing protein [Deferribacterales bacterium]